MKKYLLGTCFLFGSLIWLPAQETPAPAVTTAVGCPVAANDGYILDANGKHYQLTARNISFASYVGKKVRVVGTESYSKKPGTNGKAQNMLIRADSPTLTVSKIVKLADTCDQSQ